MPRPRRRLWAVAPVAQWPTDPLSPKAVKQTAVRIIERESGDLVADFHILKGRSNALRAARECVTAHNATITPQPKVKNEQNQNPGARCQWPI